MLKRFAAGLACGMMLVACGDGGGTSTTESIANSAASSPSVAKAADPSLTAASALSRIAAGEEFKVQFDTCPQSDEGWTGEADPLGTIKCGEVYTVRFDASSAKFSATGLNEGSGDVSTDLGDGTSPAEGGFSIWGATFNIREAGVVLSRDGVPVGHMHFGP